MEGYKFIGEVKDLYSLFSDELSKKIFLSRIKCDINKSLSNILELAKFSGLLSEEQLEFQENMKKIFCSIRKNDKKIILYGAGKLGRKVAQFIVNEGLDFDGFCDYNYFDFSDGLLDKNVYSPEWILKNKENIYIIIAVLWEKESVKDFLLSHDFPQEHILEFINLNINPNGEQYFHFINYMSDNTAYIDAGCYDGADSIRFAEKFNGNYSRIYSFEPDHNNYKICQESLKELLRTDVIEAGVGDATTQLLFAKTGTMHSKIVSSEKIQPPNDIVYDKIDVFSLDELIKNDIVGFIKMDVEGAELSALIGAKNIIATQKPMLAICVYHKPGDVLEIMSYLHKMVPEYKFYLRHYSTWHYETVLYAIIEE